MSNDDFGTIRDLIITITAAATGRRLAPGPETGRCDFSSLGVDSVNVFEITLQIEKRYALSLPDAFLFEHRTPDDAAAALIEMASSKLFSREQ